MMRKVLHHIPHGDSRTVNHSIRKLTVVFVLLTLALCSCKTKYIETVRYQPVEVHDTVHNTVHVRDSITLHDSVYIHQKNDTVLVEKWHTKYKWKATHDTMYISKEIPHVMTDTIKVIKEVPVEKIVYKQRWWQRLLGGCGLASLIGVAIAVYFNLRKR